MAVYQHKFGFNGATNNDYGLITAIFSPDTGEIDGFLGMQASFSDSYDGTKRYDYGAKFSSVANLKVSLIKSNGADFSLDQFRNIARWLSGKRKVQWLDLYNSSDEIEYSFLGRFIDVVPYMLDGRCIGIIGTFEATTPWAVSSLQIQTYEVINQEVFTIDNQTDDSETYIYPNIEFTNASSGGKLSITNSATNETTSVQNLAQNERISISSNQFIISDKPAKTFGDDFNFVFLKLAPGENEITIFGNGTITIQYRYFLKVAHALTNIENTYTESTVNVSEERIREIINEVLGGILDGYY